MGGWLGARVRGYLGLYELRQQLEATKLRVRRLEQDSKDAWEKLERLEDSTIRMPPKGDA